MTSRETRTDTRESLTHAPGCVLWLDGKAWESGSELRATQAPVPVDVWIAATRHKGYAVAWTPEGALAEGPYAGGAVVEVDSDVPGDAGRTYFAVPPEALDRLREIMPARDYEMVREDIANVANPEARGYTVTRIDPKAWEQRRQVVPNAVPIPTETWAVVIREHRMRVTPPVGNALPMDSLYPAGQVVTVDDAAGRSYFAVPRAAYGLAYDLADESAGYTALDAGVGEAPHNVAASPAGAS